MNKYKRALIRFMELKQAKLGSDYKYFTYEDANVIDKHWSDEEAKKVFKELMKNKVKCDFYEGLYAGACPFCIYHDIICENCEYGENHEVCESGNSDWGKIPSKIKDDFDWVSLLEKSINEVWYENQSELKFWEEKSDFDPDDQWYMRFYRSSITETDKIKICFVNKNGDIIERSNILMFDERGVSAYVNVNEEIIRKYFKKCDRV